VSADDPAFGQLHEIYTNQKEARSKCAICDRKLNTVNGPPRSARYHSELLELYRGSISEYIVEAGKTYLIVQVSDLQGPRKLKITMSDFALYRTTAWGASGMRTLAGHSGDWRQIDNLADEAFEWFKHIGIAHLRREVRKAGLEVWF